MANTSESLLGKQHVLEVENHMAGLRIDAFLSRMITDTSRTAIGEIIKQGNLECKKDRTWEIVLKTSQRVDTGDIYRLNIPSTQPLRDIEPEQMDLDIIFEDEHLLVVNKPPQLVVHPAGGHHRGTLVHGLVAHYGKNLSGVGGNDRPGIVHRLDKDTSGLMVVAKNDASHRALSAQLADRTLTREYEALVWGKFLHKELHVNHPIGRHPKKREVYTVREGGREAKSTFWSKELLGKGRFTLVGCKLTTGRTHQIRVHLQHQKFEIVGDPVYGRTRVGKLSERYNKDTQLITALHKVLDFPRQCLHARRIAFCHPLTQKTLAFEAPVPHDAKELLDSLRNL